MERHCFTTEVYYDHKNNKTTLEVPEKLVERLGLDYGEELSLIEKDGQLIVSKLANVELDLTPSEWEEFSRKAKKNNLTVEEYFTEVLNVLTKE